MGLGGQLQAGAESVDDGALLGVGGGEQRAPCEGVYALGLLGQCRVKMFSKHAQGGLVRGEGGDPEGEGAHLSPRLRAVVPFPSQAGPRADGVLASLGLKRAFFGLGCGAQLARTSGLDQPEAKQGGVKRRAVVLGPAYPLRKRWVPQPFLRGAWSGSRVMVGRGRAKEEVVRIRRAQLKQKGGPFVWFKEVLGFQERLGFKGSRGTVRKVHGPRLAKHPAKQLKLPRVVQRADDRSP